jgi:hypothetical protein
MFQAVAQTAQRPARPLDLGHLHEGSPRSSGPVAVARVCATGWFMHHTSVARTSCLAAERLRRPGSAKTYDSAVR